MGKALPDNNKAAYSLFNALSKTQMSTLTHGFSICQETDVLAADPPDPSTLT